MARRWFDASRGAEFWDAERLQVGCLREIVVYNDDGGEVGTAFVMMTRVGKLNPHGALCVVEYLADRGACNGTWGKPAFDVAFETMIIRGSITLSLSVQKAGNFETCFE